MSPQPETCPGCGAHVHPEDAHCPECGLELARPRRRLLPVLVGVLGVLVALAAGAGVWLLLSPKPGDKVVARQEAAIPAAIPAAPEPAPAAPEPPPAPTPVPPAPAQAAAPPAPPPPQAPLQALPPGGRPALPAVPSDPASRREFAKTTQDNFKENGLDIAVTAGGDDATVMNLKFNFPARTAVELIAGGPFPRQCKARGFQKVTFADSTGATWTYDVDTDKLTQK
ncbi:zinc ribbon domain-containing protein [Azorhizobium doebereinerae]|uniref:zinc ribbon domain-containing protein n=1 Tax=Azorhizobium doebereinerae TaxID=281091 RepID=UPI0003F562F7|nr:zinc ribbon domain-containing protein [Azorhizobium doebereinerae]